MLLFWGIFPRHILVQGVPVPNVDEVISLANSAEIEVSGPVHEMVLTGAAIFQVGAIGEPGVFVW